MQTRENDLVKAIQAADWSGVSIGNKVLIQAALAEIEKLRADLARERGYNPAHSIREAIERFDRANGKGPERNTGN